MAGVTKRHKRCETKHILQQGGTNSTHSDWQVGDITPANGFIPVVSMFYTDIWIIKKMTLGLATFEGHWCGVWLAVGWWFLRVNPQGRWKWSEPSVFHLPLSRQQFPTLVTVHALRITCWCWTRALLQQTLVCFVSPGQRWRNGGCSPFVCVRTQDSVLPPSSSACRRRRPGGTVNREERVIDDHDND